MGTQENDKKVLIYFYYLALTRQKEASDTSTYDIAQITNIFSKMLEYTLKKSLKRPIIKRQKTRVDFC